MPNEIKTKLKPVIIILLILIVAVAGFFIVRSILNSKGMPNLDFPETNTTETTDTTIDDIFGEDITQEEKDFLSTNQTIEPTITETNINTNNNAIALTDDGLYEANNNNNIPDIVPQPTKKPSSGNSAYIYDTTGTVVVEPNMGNNQTFNNNQAVNISSFIINYNDRFVASKSEPLLITLAVKTPPQGKFAKIRFYARRIDDNYNILSRDLIFYLPKIYVIDGQAQTQFYFAGRKSPLSGGQYLPKGRYLLYAEAEITDSNGMPVGKTGRYPQPQWNYVITLK
ncbi:hypothetical protein R4I97_11500 [Brachyspira pilosicoli]|uniref:hypothetical protein n=1 Tax=Brachyspira pilosicoli TaxID=52584 RepID=UPI003003DCBC